MKTKPKDIETLEHKYLNKFYHYLKSMEDQMLFGFQTKEKIKEDWIKEWQPVKQNKGISSFSTGAERIVYALFNKEVFGQPNSSPIGSDLFFETEDAFIHIDLKTVQTRNIGDYNKSIFVGDNQNSYAGEINVAGKIVREYKASLPPIYNNSGNPKPCLSYFVTILYDEDTLETLNVNIICMPNGLLSDVYGSEVLKPGKNPGKVRFNFSKCSNFKLLGSESRIKVIYFNEAMSGKDKKKLKFIEAIYHSKSIQ